MLSYRSTKLMQFKLNIVSGISYHFIVLKALSCVYLKTKSKGIKNIIKSKYSLLIILFLIARNNQKAILYVFHFKVQK